MIDDSGFIARVEAGGQDRYPRLRAKVRRASTRGRVGKPVGNVVARGA